MRKRKSWFVKIDSSVTIEQQRDPRFNALQSEAEYLFTAAGFAGMRRNICVHEAGHAVYYRLAGLNVSFRGPTMMWDTRPQYNKPAISRAATICDTRALESIEDVGLVMKASVGGFVFREVLTDSPNDRIAIESDLHSARDWYQEPIGLDEACFLLHIKTAKNSVRTDLKNPTFVKLAWDTAREIEETIFPQPPRVLSVADILGDECRC